MIAERINRALSALYGRPAVTLDDIVAAVIGDGLPVPTPHADLALQVRMHLRGEPLLEGLAGAMQLGCERARAAGRALPGVPALCDAVLRSNPAATGDEIDAALVTFCEHQQAEGIRLAGQADVLRVESIRRRALR
jgi:hypothetical protein